jgi:hypothetical protein
MTVQIDVGGRAVSVDLDLADGSWHAAEELEESDFPLITFVDRRRYELYSDGTVAEVE